MTDRCAVEASVKRYIEVWFVNGTNLHCEPAVRTVYRARGVERIRLRFGLRWRPVTLDDPHRVFLTPRPRGYHLRRWNR